MPTAVPHNAIGPADSALAERREGTVTRAVNGIGRGQHMTHDPAFPCVYEQLQSLAVSAMRRRNDGWRLRPTDLVHEAYLKVFDHGPVRWENRRHFYGAAANAMRQVLIDLSRKKGARCVGDTVDLDALNQTGGVWYRARGRSPAAFSPARVGELLDEFAALRERAAEIARLRLFAGLSLPEIARALPAPLRTVQREWALAQKWLLSRARAEERESGEWTRL